MREVREGGGDGGAPVFGLVFGFGAGFGVGHGRELGGAIDPVARGGGRVVVRVVVVRSRAGTVHEGLWVGAERERVWMNGMTMRMGGRKKRGVKERDAPLAMSFSPEAPSSAMCTSLSIWYFIRPSSTLTFSSTTRASIVASTRSPAPSPRAARSFALKGA